MKKTILGLAVLSWSGLSFASGFQLQEQSTLYLGTAYAGTAAWGADASSAWYNPAALTRVKCKEIVASGILVNNSAAFRASSTNIPFQPGVPVPGDLTDNDNPGGLSVVPALHYAARIHPNLVFGFSIAAPFGLSTDYDPKKVMRYVATYSEVITIDFSPSFAYKPTSWLSLGAGLDALFMDASFDAQTTLGTNGDPAFDGFQKNRASDWAWGWHAGLLIDLSQCTRVGLNYHSKYDVNLKGISRQQAPIAPPYPTQSGEYVLRDVRADVVLPDTLILSAYHEFNRCWAVMADASWTTWSRLQSLDLRFNQLPNDALPLIVPINTTTELEFRDTYKLALGVNYTYNRHWQWRVGTAYDKSPVRGVESRTARLPDADRTWLALGLSYTWTQLRLDLGYAHLFIKGACLDDHGPLTTATCTPALLFNDVSGKYSSHADLFGIQLRYDFV